jgi:hypothetical protein
MKAEEMYGNGGYRCESGHVLLGKPVLTSFTQTSAMVHLSRVLATLRLLTPLVTVQPITPKRLCMIFAHGRYVYLAYVFSFNSKSYFDRCEIFPRRFVDSFVHLNMDPDNGAYCSVCSQSQRDHNVAVDTDSLRELTINTQ